MPERRNDRIPDPYVSNTGESLRRRQNLRRVGDEGEEIARRYLVRQGFAILESNWTARAAEIDLIAVDENRTVWFFEVKFRRNQSAGSATEAFGFKKRLAFFRAVSLCCAKRGLDFDLVRTGLIAIDRTDAGFRITRISDLRPDGT